jgi:DNA-binding transcriptional MerR regulator
MLSEKQFRDRASTELRKIGKQVKQLATDRDLYRKLESDVLAVNPRLSKPNVYLAMIRGAYTDAMLSRVLRLIDAEGAGLSLRRIMAQLREHPHLMHDKLTGREFADDVAQLDRASEQIKRHLDSHLGAHERKASALQPSHRALNHGLDLLLDLLRKYYWIVSDAYLDLDVKHEGDPLGVFHFAWLDAGSESTK